MDCPIKAVSESLTTKKLRKPDALTLSTDISTDEFDLDAITFDQSHRDFKDALLKRDGVCIVCWRPDRLLAVHIAVLRKEVTTELRKIISNKLEIDGGHTVRDGLLMCESCYCRFTALTLYIECIDGDYFVKCLDSYTNGIYFNFITDASMRKLPKVLPASKVAERSVKEKKDEMKVCFESREVSDYPNCTALHYQQIACLIWEFARGVDENEDSDCENEYDDGSDSDENDQRYALSDRMKAIVKAWKLRSSNSTFLFRFTPPSIRFNPLSI